MDIKLKKIQVENFRNFKNVNFEIGKKITAINDTKFDFPTPF